MGQTHSDDREHGKENTAISAPKKCYYEVLGVDPQSPDEELKRAYRRKALVLHPDRNFGDATEATRLFAEVQAAYEVLSDPNERAWYDSHRDSILHHESENTGTVYEKDISITTVEDITKLYATFDGHFEFSDAPSGFYTVIREFFKRLAHEEKLACNRENCEYIEYPTFGTAKDNYEDVVKPFYGAWSGFATKKVFYWKDIHRYTEASDRRSRRMMEKENRRLREDAIRDFNDAVRAAVAYVRRRDPRYTSNHQSQESRQIMLRKLAATQAAKSRAANQAKLADKFAPDWTTAHNSYQDEVSELYGGDLVAEERTENLFECVVCKKMFKSENQYLAHEKSKKHAKAIYQLRRKMRHEDTILRTGTKDRASNSTTSPQSLSGQKTFESTPYADSDSSLEASKLDAGTDALFTTSNDMHIEEDGSADIAEASPAIAIGSATSSLDS